jgi:hypothetical protein
MSAIDPGRRDKKQCVNKLAEETAPTHLLRHMIKEDAEDAPDAALRCAFCASAPFLFAIVILQTNSVKSWLLFGMIRPKCYAKSSCWKTCGFTRQGRFALDMGKSALACERPSLSRKALPQIPVLPLVRRMSIEVEGSLIAKHMNQIQRVNTHVTGTGKRNMQK